MAYEGYKLLQKEELFFKVEGENETNKILNYVCPKLREYFKDKLDKQIFKSGADVIRAELFKKYNDEVYLILEQAKKKFTTKDINPQIFLNCSLYSVYVEVKIRFNNKSKNGFLYYYNSKYILNMTDLKIRNLYDFEPFKKINPEKQYKIFLRCLELKEKYKKEQSKLKPYRLKELVK